MQATQTTIDALMNSKTQFRIPVYQRNYSWTIEQCATLFDDLLKIYEGTFEKHFIGLIAHKPEDGNSKVTNLIDGQQRYTTISLLLIALRDNTDNESVINKIDSLLSDDIFGMIKLVLNEYDNEVYKLVLEEKTELITEKNHSIYNNYMFFKNALKEYDAITIYRAITQLEVIDMELGYRDDPQVIFESINSTGLGLTNADLIRNFLLMNESYDTQTELFNKYWKKFEQKLGVSNVAQFFEHFVNGQSPKRVTSKNMYPEFKKYYSSKWNNSNDCLAYLDNYVDSYCYLVNENIPLKLSNDNNTKEVNNLLSDLRRLNSTSSYLFLMEVLNYFKDAKITEDDLIFTLKTVNSYIFRRLIVGNSSNAITTVFLSLASQVRNTYELLGYRDSLVYNLVYTKKYTNGVFPSNEEFINALCTKNIYNKQSQINYILRKLETNLNTHIIIDESTLSIEHVMPQILTSEWRNILGENYKEAYDSHVNTLGNLTYTSINSQLSNHFFDAKKQLLEDEGSIRLNGYFKNIEQWNIEEIEKRSLYLAKEASKIWDYPLIEEEKLNNYLEESKKVMDLDQLMDEKPKISYGRFYIQDNAYEVKSYRDLLQAAIIHTYNTNSERFENFVIDKYPVTIDGLPESVFTHKPVSNERKYRYVSSVDVYFIANVNSYTMISRIKLLLKEFDIDESEVYYEL